MVTGVCLWCVAVNPYLMTATTFIAKFFVSISFYIVYVMTPELFPTQLRHTTTAFDSGFARVGGILVSFILYKGATATHRQLFTAV